MTCETFLLLVSFMQQRMAREGQELRDEDMWSDKRQEIKAEAQSQGKFSE
jgi:hypothetical protein